MNSKAAFSIVEIIVVIIIMGVLAAVAIPNYLIGLNRTNARNALNNLVAIQSAQIVYAEVHNAYYGTATFIDDSANLNQNLHLNITPDAQTIYYCDNSKDWCHSVRSGTGGFNIAVDLTLPMNRVGSNLVYCTAAAPDITYNPCCLITDAVTQSTGNICP